MQDERVEQASGADVPSASSGMDESEIITRTKGADPAAWSYLYERYYPLSIGCISAPVRTATAEDVTAEVFLSAVKGIGSYKDHSRPFVAWLNGISRRAVADHQRRVLGRSGFRLPFMRVDDTDVVAPPSSDPANHTERIALQDAMRRLRPAQREVIILHYYVGMDTNEMSVALGKRPTALYSLEARALIALRVDLGDRENS